MKFESINRKYTEMVNEYIGRGYYINAGTMSGSQGEIAHIDLTDGKDIIRILMEGFNDYERGIEGIRITAGKCTEDTKPNGSRDIGCGIWNHRLEVIETAESFLVGEVRGNKEYYGTYDEAVAARDKRYQRYENRPCDTKKVELPEAAKEIALRWVKKNLTFKRIGLASIDAVYSVTTLNRFDGKQRRSYVVSVKGKQYQLK